MTRLGDTNGFNPFEVISVELDYLFNYFPLHNTTLGLRSATDHPFNCVRPFLACSAPSLWGWGAMGCGGMTQRSLLSVHLFDAG
jgi:hypothetical protein